MLVREEGQGLLEGTPRDAKESSNGGMKRPGSCGERDARERRDTEEDGRLCEALVCTEGTPREG